VETADGIDRADEEDDSDDEPVAALGTAVPADLREAHRELKEQDTPFRRRGYVRTVFACIDGFVAAMRQTAVLHPDKFDPEELILLRETAPVIGSKGKISQIRNKTSLRDALPFSFNSYMKAHGAQATLAGDKEWDNFLEGIRIRDRVTHPKSAADFDVSDADLECMEHITEWLMNSTVEGMMEKTPMGVLIVGGLLLLASVWGANRDLSMSDPAD
jgi:hypothetical protein